LFLIPDRSKQASEEFKATRSANLKVPMVIIIFLPQFIIKLGQVTYCNESNTRFRQDSRHVTKLLFLMVFYTANGRLKFKFVKETDKSFTV
jgi:hypothetical protein